MEHDNLDAEIKTVDTILDRGIRVDLPAPRFLRLFGKKTIVFIIKRPDGQTMYEISRMYLKMKKGTVTLEPETIDEAHRMVVDCFLPVSRIIAYAIKPEYGTIKNRILARYLRRTLDSRQIAELVALIVGSVGVHDFSNTIRLLGGMRLTKPRIPTI